MLRKQILTYAEQTLCYEKDQLALLNHGIDIIANDGTNYLFVLIISFLLKDLRAGVTFIISFSMLRRYTGGWHAQKRSECFLCYQMMFISSWFLCHIHFHSVLSLYIYGLCCLITVMNSPVIHPHNPLSEKEVLHNRKLTLIMVMLSFSIYMMIQCRMMFLTMLLNLACMIFLKCRKKRGLL